MRETTTERRDYRTEYQKAYDDLRTRQCQKCLFPKQNGRCRNTRCQGYGQ